MIAYAVVKFFKKLLALRRQRTVKASGKFQKLCSGAARICV